MTLNKGMLQIVSTAGNPKVQYGCLFGKLSVSFDNTTLSHTRNVYIQLTIPTYLKAYNSPWLLVIFNIFSYDIMRSICTGELTFTK